MTVAKPTRVGHFALEDLHQLGADLAVEPIGALAQAEPSDTIWKHSMTSPSAKSGEPCQADAALEPGCNLAHVVLEAAERLDAGLDDELAAAQQPGLAAAHDSAVEDVRAGDRARLAGLDELADLSVALDLLDELRRQEALERELDVIGQLVDDLVQAHVHPGGLHRPLGTGVEPGVESHDHRLGGRRQEHVGLVDVAGALAEDVDPGFGGAQPIEGVADGAQRALDIGLQDDAQLLDLRRLDLGADVLEAGRAGTRRAARPPRRRREQPSRRPPPAAGPRPRQVLKTEDLDRGRRLGRTPVGRPRSGGRGRPEVLPTVTISPTFSVPVWTRTVATLPRPLSTLDSMIVP